MAELEVLQRSEGSLLGAPLLGTGVSTALVGKNEDIERKNGIQAKAH